MKNVDFSREEGVAIIRMDDGKANALGLEMIRTLEEALERARTEASAVVLTGRVGRFSGGFDLNVLMSDYEAALDLVETAGRLFMRIYEHPQPVVAACSGHAVAGGAVLLMCADERLCAEGKFRIGLTEVSIGMPPPLFVVDLARDRLSALHRSQAVIGSRVYDPPGAVEAGFIDRVVPADHLLSEAVKKAARLAELPAGAYADTKLRLRRPTLKQVRATLAADRATWGRPGTVPAR
jgi:enoyl-CoA hydratase